MDESSVEGLPAPDGVLVHPNIVDWAVGRVLHRVHDRRFSGNAFNPCKGRPTRFAPIEDPQGCCVPSLYAGSTVEAAIYETVFHDTPVTSNAAKTVPRGEVATRQHSVLLPLRRLRLASLRAPDLRKWHIRRANLIGSPPTQYGRTRPWAKAIHDSFDVDGLIWTSNQCDPADAMLLFGDRVTTDALAIASRRFGTDDSFIEDVRQAGRRGGITITL